MSLKFDIDLKQFSDQMKKFKKEFESDMHVAVGSLASMTHAKTLELTNQLSSSIQKTYRDALSFEKIEEGVWIVNLDSKAMWIEEGLDPYSMYDTHLRSPKAKTSVEGHKYLTIPFKHNKNPSEQSASAQNLTTQIRKELKDRGIPYKKLELGPDGSPRIGRLHAFNIDSAKPSAKAKDPALKGLTIYQTKQADGSIRRDIMTFRVISEKTKGDGRWQHPGRDASQLMDEAFRWAETTWETQILPELLKKYE
jgi:hypothetical protein